ncbi:MAG: hypothetical protein WC600_02590 [Desulfobaccales bacterium]
MERKVEAEIYKATYWDENVRDEDLKEQWRNIPKYAPRVKVLYILACRNCRQLMWGEMEVKESNDKEVLIPHFFNHSGDDRQEFTRCPDQDCKKELYPQEDGLNISLVGGKVRIDPGATRPKGCLFRSPRELQSQFTNDYDRFSGKRPA